MDAISTNVQKLLARSIEFKELSELTQNEIGKSHVVLWNKEPLQIDRKVYLEFVESVKKRHHHRFYMFNNILSYPDFCISLICSVQYSLNHTATVSIPQRTYEATWRIIDTISAVGSSEVKGWINKYIDDRSAKGYCVQLGVTSDNAMTFMPYGNGNSNSGNLRDIEVISSVGLRDKIVKVPVYDENDYSQEYQRFGTVFDSSYTPEGQLYDLSNAHITYTRKV